MTRKVITTMFGFGLMVGIVATARSPLAGVASVSASAAQNGPLHVVKECSEWQGKAGDFCTITESSLPAITAGTRVYYDQAAGVPSGFLDSNVLLYAGANDWAVGRCTVDATDHGLCTFTDGVGQFAGFSARVTVSVADRGLPYFDWTGSYSFSPIRPDRP